MIKITDRTLSCLDEYDTDRELLPRLLELLIETEVDGIELSEKMYRLLSPLPHFTGYAVRVNQPADISGYVGVSRFVIRNCEPVSDPRICSEIILNDMREAYTIARFADCGKIRVCGLDDVMLGDYLSVFKNVRSGFHGDFEFCPGDRFYTAAAIASEWITGGAGDAVAASFGGIGGFAPTEELIIALKLRRLRKVGKKYPFFPEIAEIIAKITGESFKSGKPVIGGRIFCVESGIHVDGITKQPKCYEPFPPDTVGLTRRVILGKQSGKAAIRAKADELGIKCREELLPQILSQVKSLGAKKCGEVTDEEFSEIARGCRA